MKASERIICALDLDEPAKAWQMVESLAGRISFYKVGMLLYLAGAARWFAI